MHHMRHRGPGACAIAALLIVALTSCGNSDAAIGQASASTDANSAAAPASAPTAMEKPMSANDCGTSNLSHSICAIRLMLDDVENGLGDGAGGGVTAIKAESSTAFSIRLSKEGRAVTYHYEFDFDSSPAKVKSRTETVESFGH